MLIFFVNILLKVTNIKLHKIIFNENSVNIFIKLMIINSV